MKKIQIVKPGGYDRLEVVEGPSEVLLPGQVRIAVKAIGVNYADCVVRMGLYAPAARYVGWPITPGFEVAGTIAEVGEGVVDFALGQEVLAVTRFGGYTSELVVPSHQVFRLPENLSFEEGASLLTVFLTAYYAMFELASPKAGQVHLIHSAAGGVGSALVQLSRLAKCKAVGVVGASHKVEYAQSLGCDRVIDKSKERLWKAAKEFAPDGYHAIFDANGVATLKQSQHHLASPGRLVVYGFHSMLPKKGGRPNWLKLVWDYLRTPRFSPLNLTGSNHSILGFNLAYLFEEVEILASSTQQVLDWFSEEKLRPPAIKVYPLEDVAQAHRDLESAQTVGKLVLVVG